MMEMTTPTNNEKVHISSLVVHCCPEKLDNILQHTANIRHVEIATYDTSGKIIALLETPTEKEILYITGQIEMIDGVLGATMVYHQIDC